MSKKIGELSSAVINTLGIPGAAANDPIYIGETNIKHMKDKHPNAYSQHGKDIPDIIRAPDYVGCAPGGSIEFIKENKSEHEFVKVAVRASDANMLYVRTIYTVNPSRVNNFIKKGKLKSIK